MERFRLLPTFFATAILIATPGCKSVRSLYAQSRVDPVSIATYAPAKPVESQQPDCGLVSSSPHDTRTGAIDLDCFQFPEDRLVWRNLVGPERPTAYSRAVASKAERNRLTSILMKQSDDICTLELGRLTANESITNTSLSIIGTGLSAAASIVSGETAKSILAGTAGFAGASRDHINVHVYRNTIAQAISQTIASDRKTKADTIRSRYVDERDLWSIDDAIRDVNAYHGSCSFYKGLELLLKAADNQTYLADLLKVEASQREYEAIERELTKLRKEIAAGVGDQPALVARYNELILRRSRLVEIVPVKTVTLEK